MHLKTSYYDVCNKLQPLTRVQTTVFCSVKAFLIHHLARIACLDTFCYWESPEFAAWRQRYLSSLLAAVGTVFAAFLGSHGNKSGNVKDWHALKEQETHVATSVITRCRSAEPPSHPSVPTMQPEVSPLPMALASFLSHPPPQLKNQVIQQVHSQPVCSAPPVYGEKIAFKYKSRQLCVVWVLSQSESVFQKWHGSTRRLRGPWKAHLVFTWY